MSEESTDGTQQLPPVPVVPTGMSITLRLDSTVTLYDSVGNATDWIKPGVETSMKFNGVPDGNQVDAAIKAMRDGVLNPVLSDVLASVQERTTALRQGRL